ncbi:MAG: arylsulfatase, partial [Planctomycetes bacterium]|nr:arylsulfatase [Planctomycetota bacterium]
MLKQKGYDTAAFGKWHLGMDWPKTGNNIDFKQPIKNGPIDRGFDYYFGMDSPNYPPHCFIENDRTVGFPKVKKPESMYGHDGPMLPGWKLEEILPSITDRVVGYIEEKGRKIRERPFFIYYALTAPHTPIAPSPEFIGKSQAGRYGDFVCQLDACVGQILEALKRSGLENDTLVIFASDNGSCGMDGEGYGGEFGSVQRYGHQPNAPFRGMKADAWEGGHRIPFLARWPKKIPSGATCDETICLMDLMATLAALAGIDLPENAGEDSYDILPALLGDKSRKPIREALVHHSGTGMKAIRQGRWKLIQGRGSGGFSPPKAIAPEEGEPGGQLYDLIEDPGETTNLYLERPKIVERLDRLLERYIREGRSTPR